MANAIFAVVYTSNKGHRYIVGMNSEVFNQLSSGGAPKVGGSLWDGAELLDNIPGNMKPRRARMTSPGKPARYITVLTESASLWNSASALADRQLNIEDSDGVASLYTFDAPKAEEQRRRKRVA